MADNEPSAAGTPPANNPPAGGDTQQQPQQGPPNIAPGAGNPGVPGSGSGPEKFSRREIWEKSKDADFRNQKGPHKARIKSIA